MIGLYLEEIVEGRVVELGQHHFTRGAIIAFAGQYDPQPFHLDDEVARKGPLGALSASGWHTAAGWMKCYVATNQAAEAKMRAEGREPAAIGPSPGLANLRWLKPVTPGDTITYRSTVTGKRELNSRPQWGLVFTLNEGFNQKGELVFSFEGKVLTPKRPA
ncbi:MaoC family dehydratase [Aestuariivirga sp.]|uniref:MaoC family dehydratase n=1 Tax=Aestuariivirga sp. TaxID=2650926 RepID=UPI0025BA318C|nr:MaoC family dehydratase [Aestuariivirga sp.]